MTDDNMLSGVPAHKKKTVFRLGLVINPLAGIGGPAALKGSDHKRTEEIAASRGVVSKTNQRVKEMLSEFRQSDFKSHIDTFHIITASGAMGESACEPFSADFDIDVVYDSPAVSRAIDTYQAAQKIKSRGVDLLLFVGGDGTARDIYKALGETQIVLGLPAGVKMHSGVFAVTPKAVVSVITSMIQHHLVAGRMAEVRDIDEAEFVKGRVRTQYFGEMLIPDDQLLVQSVKCSGMLDDEIMLDELCAYLHEEIEDDCLYVLGSGGTTNRLKLTLGVDNPTLLGVDAWYNGEVIALDAHESQLFELIKAYSEVRIVLSIIGGQGIVLGRGNQQISPRIIEQVGVENLQFISTQKKILALEGAPLRVDSGSDALDQKLSGFHKIICGYDDALIYEIRYLD